jgi:hypothetical protein
MNCMNVKHDYLAVRCSTAGCGIHLLLKYLGPHNPLRVPMLTDGPETFEVPCGACRETHTYTRDEVQWIIYPEAPAPDFPAHF